MESTLKLYKQSSLEKIDELFSIGEETMKAVCDNNFSSIKKIQSQEFQVNLQKSLPDLDYGRSRKQHEEVGSDGENAIRLHSSLGSGKLELFLDQRFWTYLCMNRYSDYCWNRWLKNASFATKAKRVNERFLTFKSVQATRQMSINAIGRLWLGAHLTYNDKSKGISFFFKNIDDDYKYARLVFSNQNIYQQLSQRSYITRNKNIILSILHFMDERSIASKDNVIYICKVLDIHLNNSRIALSEPEEILDIIDKIVDHEKIKSTQKKDFLKDIARRNR